MLTDNEKKRETEALNDEFNSSETMRIETYNARLLEIDKRARQRESAPAPDWVSKAELKNLIKRIAHASVKQEVSLRARIIGLEERIKAIEPLNARIAELVETKLKALDARPEGSSPGWALDDMSRQLAYLGKTLSQPVTVKPIYDEKGKLVGAVRSQGGVEARIAELNGEESGIDRALAPPGEIESLKKQIADLRSRPAMIYKGVWNASEKYLPGNFVTQAGSCWHAEIESKGVRPGVNDGLAWVLAVKHGRDMR